MRWVKRIMERGQPPTVAPYGTTPRGYPFPLRSWPPDAAVDIQNLATAIDTDASAVRDYAHLAWGSGSAAAGQAKITGTAGTQVLSGITFTNNTATIVKRGRYAIAAQCVFSGVAANQAGAAQVRAAGTIIAGTWASSSAGYCTSDVGIILSLDAGQTVEVWTNCAAAMTKESAYLNIQYVGLY